MDIVVERATVARGGRRIVEAASFGARAGRAAALRGPNGSGKTTLLRAMAGLLPLDGGDVRVGDASIARDRDGAQERIAYAGHRDAVKPQLSVADNLRFWAGFFGAADAVRRADSALAQFDLAAIADAPAAHCSAGQRRRLGLARLVVADRPVWLLDEPTVSLDTESVARFSGLLESHLASGGAAVIATHVDIGLAEVDEIDLIASQERDVAAPADADPFLDGWDAR